MNQDIADMALVSQYYPDGIYDHLVQEHAIGNDQKERRRRRKGKKGEEGLISQKRKLTDEQVIALEKCFRIEPKLESERKEKLAAELRLDPRQVAVWFQNRRVRWKGKKMEEEYSKLKSEHEITIVEKCHLETQVLKLQEQLSEAEKEIARLSERWDGSSNSPSSSFSMEPPFLGEFGMEGLERVFCLPQNDQYGYGADEMEWKSLFNM